MTLSAAGIRPQLYARLCGALYLYIIVAGLFAEMFARGLVVPGDAETTARNILANESLFRLGLSGEFLHLACDVGVAVLLYALLKPVDRYISLFAAFQRLACVVVLATAGVSQFATLRLLGHADYLKSIPSDESHALALLAMRLHSDGYAVSLVFFGFACLAAGYLIYRSTYLPKAIGILMAVAGACYLVNSLVRFLAPTVAAGLFPWILLPPFIGELALALWLLFKGVDIARWSAFANAGSGRLTGPAT
jgi:Domain of unknown function (DUF4386)